ncbi:ZIP family metal transporter [Sporosalibacterium faouarense]|uniref:ZIP family metal transporter n=1 Tax=Sporosalibacterium faouarense TaxID=516123 RepID=UPI00192BC8AF|nr:ZIP family metal transporter [Sporosalibacterium faouarense]
MQEVLSITILGSLVGIVGTGLGGIIALSLVRPNNKFLSILLGFTSGLMIAVVTLDLLPESQKIGGIRIEIIGIILGIITVIFIDNMLPKNITKNGLNKEDSFLKAGIMIGLGIAIHNLPEGLAVGSSFIFTADMGIRMALVISLHNLPEGIAMATPLRIGGFPKIKVLLLTLASGVPTGLGAFMGALLGNISDSFIALCLAIAGGTMLYITCGELIPNAKTLHKGRASTIGVIIGFIFGMIFVVK